LSANKFGQLLGQGAPSICGEIGAEMLARNPQEGGTGGSACATFTGMDDFPIIPPIIVKDTPKPRRITMIKEARDYVDEAMRLGRPASWREVWHRIKMVTGEDEAIEAIGDLRELLAAEDLLLPDEGTR
jgi:hypothetical protein